MSKAIEVDTKTFVRFWLVVAGIAVLGLFLWRARMGLILVGLSIFLAIAIRPLADKIDQIDKTHRRKTLTSVLAVTLVVALVGFIIAVIGPMMVTETGKFLSSAPETIQSSLGGVEGIDEFGKKLGIDNLSGEVVTLVKNFASGFVSNISSTVVTSISTIANVATGVILVIVLTILFMTQGPALLKSFWKSVADKDSKTSEVIQRIMIKIADVIAKYMTGQVLVAIFDGVVVGVVICILALIFGFSVGLALPLSLFAAIFVLIPMFGPIISCAIMTLLLFFQSPWAGIVFLIFYIAYQQVESNIISPKVQGNSLNLPSLVILVAVTIGMYMFGLLGAIISIPIAGIIKVLIEEYPEIKKINS